MIIRKESWWDLFLPERLPIAIGIIQPNGNALGHLFMNANSAL